MRRVYYPHTECEEYEGGAGMWKRIAGAQQREDLTEAAADVMRSYERFKAAMLRAITEWPKSCEMTFGSISTNHRAWLGHAGCYLATGSPEETTRYGWHRLTEFQQAAANACADEVIAIWRRRRAATLGHEGQLSLFDLPQGA